MLSRLIILATLLVIASAAAGSAYPQGVLRTGSEVCKVKLTDAPRLNGYYLGQAASTISIDFNQQKIPFIKVAGVQDSATATAENSARHIRLVSSAKEITSVILHFVGYQPKDIEHFVQDFSRVAKVSINMFAVNTERQAAMRCNGYVVYLKLLPTDNEKYVIPTVILEKYVEADITKEGRPRGAPLDSELDRIRRDKAEFDKNPRKHVGGGRGPVVGP